MSVTITIRLAETEANALLKVERRHGWHSTPSVALQVADFKIVQAIAAARAEREDTTS
jgi:hypothetical protein